MSYLEAVSTNAWPITCIFCGRALTDAESRETGVGPVCAEKYGRGSGGPRDEGLLQAGLAAAPEPMRRAVKSALSVAQKAANVTIYHASMALSYGGSPEHIKENGIDEAKSAIAAAQTILKGLGYHNAAEQIVYMHLGGGRKESHLVIEYVGTGNDTLRLAAPYNTAFNAAARASGLFRMDKIDGVWWRQFKTSNLDAVVNLLRESFTDTLVLAPGGNLVALPAVALFIKPPETKPAPAPAHATNEAPPAPPPSKELVKGDIVRLGDGREGIVRWVGIRNGSLRIGVSVRGIPELLWFNASEVSIASKPEVQASLNKQHAADEKGAAAEGAHAPAAPHAQRAIVIEAGGKKLMPYQVVGVNWLIEKGSGLLADDCGLGKTAQSAVSLEAPAVIVCPGKIKVNWLRELAIWRPELSVQIVNGETPSKPGSLIADVIIINYEILQFHLTALQARRTNTLVADEATALKNLDVRYDKETRRMVVGKGSPALAGAFYELWRDARVVQLLTGTPILNRTEELWPLLHMVDPDEWKSFFPFGTRFCNGYQKCTRKACKEVFPYEGAVIKGECPACNRGKLVWDFSGRSNVEELHAKISGRYMLRRMKEEVLTDFPEKMRSTMHVSITNAEEYKEAAESYLRWVENNGGFEKLTAAQRAEALTKMTALRHLVAVGKVEAAVEHIEEFRDSTGKPLIVMAHHKDVLSKIGKSLSAGIRVKLYAGQADQDAFQTGEIDVLLMSIMMAKGQTLTAASDMLFVERVWRPADLVQAEDRIYRIGQKNNVSITYLDCPGTIDEAIATLLQEKTKTAAGVIDGKNLDDAGAAAVVCGALFGERRKNPGGSGGEAFSWTQPL